MRSFRRSSGRAGREVLHGQRADDRLERARKVSEKSRPRPARRRFRTEDGHRTESALRNGHFGSSAAVEHKVYLGQIKRIMLKRILLLKYIIKIYY